VDLPRGARTFAQRTLHKTSPLLSGPRVATALPKVNEWASVRFGPGLSLPPFAGSALFVEKRKRLFVVVKGDEIVVTVTQFFVPLLQTS
jgi:hypothetical protein